ncbi:PREDICTED: uncharacterized protein LOC106819421 [Priapulus caudatus]|uniref:Uncharacterized protein LOC106819421 n=1 Tax=Priapulus caudatus TaxID=37621 RepID=A0ABM1F526_PRICU|nr:PREDICTED: uncharacterized protein LOC106819421 [Priapulus caudatus]
MNAALARRILTEVKLPGDKKDQYSLISLKKADRQRFIKLCHDEEDAKICASIEIQRTWRGHRTRCNVWSILHPKASREALHPHSRLEDRLNDVATPTPTASPTKTDGRLALERRYEGYVRVWQSQPSKRGNMFK